MKIIKKLDLFILFFSLLILFSFIVGFILDENSAGAGGFNADFSIIWKNLQLFKNSIFENLNSLEYQDSRTPAYYILHVLFNPFIETQYQFRLSVFFISLLCPVIFYFTLREKYKKVDKYLIILISSLILLSPYFRTTAFWGLGENYSILCLLVSYFLFQKGNFANANINNKTIITLFLLSVSSSLCVYFDQKLLIIPCIIFISIIFNKKIDYKIKILLAFFYFLLSIPLLYLIFLWEGILPPFAQNARQVGVKFNIYNIGYVTTIIAFYFFPFLFFQKKKCINIFLNFFRKENLIFFFLFLIYLFLVTFYSNFSDVPFPGNGVIHKLVSLSSINSNLQFIYTLFFFFVSWIVINIFLEKKIFDRIIIYYFLTISFFIYPIYQEYFDPLIIVLIFTFLKNKLIINFKNIFILSLYLSIFLIIANLYYSKI
tara:strand:+ start:624 stop:1913 length:1290 start_codon:yes stop_codon:yes gene_type:complete